MIYVERSHDDLQANLDWDMDLLDLCDRGRIPGALRFWEARVPVVVAGHSNGKLAEIRVETCRELDVPVLRRSTGGGTVVLGPGCLAYSLVLRVERGGRVDGIRRTNAFVMEKNRSAIQSVFPGAVEVAGYTDLVVVGKGSVRKVSGNAQRRARRAVLFHGTFLIDFDLSIIGKLIENPRVAPDYRAGRDHGDFLANLGVSVDDVRRTMRREWGAYCPIPVNLG